MTSFLVRGIKQKTTWASVVEATLKKRQGTELTKNLEDIAVTKGTEWCLTLHQRRGERGAEAARGSWATTTRNEGRRGHDRGRLACLLRKITNGITIWVARGIGKEKEIRDTNRTREQGVEVKTAIEPGAMCAVERGFSLSIVMYTFYKLMLCCSEQGI